MLRRLLGIGVIAATIGAFAVVVALQPGMADQSLDIPATMTTTVGLQPGEVQTEPPVTGNWLDAPGIPEVQPTNLDAPADQATFTLEDVKQTREEVGHVHGPGTTKPISMECALGQEIAAKYHFQAGPDRLICAVVEEGDFVIDGPPGEGPNVFHLDKMVTYLDGRTGNLLGTSQYLGD
jgi:hypothetical protein